MLLDRSLISSYKLGQVKRESQHPISSLEFYSSHLLSSSSIDETLNLYEVDHTGGGTGGLLLRKSINSHKYGLGPTVFAHGPLNCLIASTKAAAGSGGKIHLLSLYDNSYQREFKGPEEEMVKEIKVSPTPSAGPIHDSFISLTTNTMSIWDLKCPSRSAYMSSINSAAGSGWGNESHVAIDGKGMIFALTLGNLLKLFDIRNYSKGPFASFDFSSDGTFSKTPTTPTTKTNIKGVLFTPDGSSILLNNNSTSMSIVDSFDCQLKKTLQSKGNPSTLTNPSITPNGRFILAGRSDCTISVWDLKEEEGEEEGDGNSNVVEDFLSLEGHNITPGFVEHHPTMGIMASACSNIGLWVPDIL